MFLQMIDLILPLWQKVPLVSLLRFEFKSEELKVYKQILYVDYQYSQKVEDKKNIYQTFFILGLPPVPATHKLSCFKV